MTNLRLIREPNMINSTFGVLFIDGFFECFTLENTRKIVPFGSYSLELYNSPKHKRIVPQLIGVHGRSNIQIHIANYWYELEGCIAVGRSFDSNMLRSSTIAFDEIMKKIKLPAQIRIEEWADEPSVL